MALSAFVLMLRVSVSTGRTFFDANVVSICEQQIPTAAHALVSVGVTVSASG